MIGEKCEYCGDEVLILKESKGKRICLDCYYKYKDGKQDYIEKNFNNKNEILYEANPRVSNVKHTSDRRCTNCGRIIPFDSIICPYCGKRFESYLW